MNKNLKVNSNGIKNSDEYINSVNTKHRLSHAINSIFKDKAPNYTEIEVSFFQYCNLRCKFCWQDNDDKTGVDSIVSKADTVINYLVSNKKNLQDNIQVHMLGGELFEDSNDFYDDLYNFVKKIHLHACLNLKDYNLDFIFVTNMNFQLEQTKNKLERFVQELKNLGCSFKLTTSWDPTGRPLKGDTSTKFHKNITHFKPYLGEITFVLTKSTIKKLLKNQTQYLDYLYNNGFTIDYDYYMPTNEVDKLMPTDWELLNAFRALLKRYPKISKLKAFWRQTGNPAKLTCASLNKVTILPDGTMTNCRHLDYDQEDFSSEIIKESNSNMIFNYLTDKSCLSCRYFNDCPFSCFLMADHKKFKQESELHDCLYRILFKELDAKELELPADI